MAAPTLRRSNSAFLYQFKAPGLYKAAFDLTRQWICTKVGTHVKFTEAGAALFA